MRGRCRGTFPSVSSSAPAGDEWWSLELFRIRESGGLAACLFVSLSVPDEKRRNSNSLTYLDRRALWRDGCALGRGHVSCISKKNELESAGDSRDGALSTRRGFSHVSLSRSPRFSLLLSSQARGAKGRTELSRAGAQDARSRRGRKSSVCVAKRKPMASGGKPMEKVGEGRRREFAFLLPLPVLLSLFHLVFVFRLFSPLSSLFFSFSWSEKSQVL